MLVSLYIKNLTFVVCLLLLQAQKGSIMKENGDEKRLVNQINAILGAASNSKGKSQSKDVVSAVLSLRDEVHTLNKLIVYAIQKLDRHK